MIITSNDKEAIFLFFQAHSVVDVLQNCNLNKMSEKALNQVSMETFSTFPSNFKFNFDNSLTNVIENNIGSNRKY